MNNEYDEILGFIIKLIDRVIEGCKLLLVNDDGVYNYIWDKLMKE